MAIYIGIDPGEDTGFAVWDSLTKSFLVVATLPIWRAMEEVNRWNYACLLAEVPVAFRVIFEDARKRTWFKPETSESEYRGKLMGAGAAKRDSKIWEEFLTAKKIPFTAQGPQAGWTKWNKDYWYNITGYKGRTSEHARDAALLVFGRR